MSRCLNTPLFVFLFLNILFSCLYQTFFVSVCFRIQVVSCCKRYSVNERTVAYKSNAPFHLLGLSDVVIGVAGFVVGWETSVTSTRSCPRTLDNLELKLSNVTTRPWNSQVKICRYFDCNYTVSVAYLFCRLFLNISMRL